MSKKAIQIYISLDQQLLSVLQEGVVTKSYKVSTAKNGPGELLNSECTPRGHHIIRAKIGDQADINTIFVGRRATGERYSPALRQQYPDRDWILTRIMWLSGCEPGVNRLGNVDTMRRYIYIHGCPDEDEMGIPDSHGCIKMRNNDVVELFDIVETGMPVYIKE